MINNIVMIILLSVIVEYIVNLIKPLMPETNYPVPLVLSMVIGICLACWSRWTSYQQLALSR